MGIFDKLQKLGEMVESVNEMAGSVGKSTVVDYGEPVYSLYTALQLGNINRRIDITDAEGNLKYYTKSRFL